MYICVCKAVTDKQIISAIEEGCSSRKELRQCLGVGEVCGKCTRHVSQLLDENNHVAPIMQAA